MATNSKHHTKGNSKMKQMLLSLSSRRWRKNNTRTHKNALDNDKAKNEFTELGSHRINYVWMVWTGEEEKEKKARHPLNLSDGRVNELATVKLLQYAKWLNKFFFFSLETI